MEKDSSSKLYSNLDSSSKLYSNFFASTSSSDAASKRSNDSFISSGHRHQTGQTVDSIREEGLRLNPYKMKQKGLIRFNDSVVTESALMSFNTNSLAPSDVENMGSLQIVKSESKREQNGFLYDMFSSKESPCCFGQQGRRNLKRMQSREEYKMPPKRVQWWQVTLYLLNDIIGAWLILYGALIPGLYGWVLGMSLLVVMWPLNMYVAHLLWRCRNVFPGAISIGDLVYYVTGSTCAMYTTFFFVNLSIALTLAFNIITVASNINWLTSYESGDCGIAFVSGAVILLFPLTQLRTLYSLTITNSINLISMLCFVGIYIYFLVLQGREDNAINRIGPNVLALRESASTENENIRASHLIGINVLVTAMTYQLIILEIMAEMKDPRDFPKANYWCTPVVLFVLVACAAFRYYYQGEEVNLTLDMPFEVVASVFNFDALGNSIVAYFGMTCFTIHMLGSSLIRSVILTRSLQLFTNPKGALLHTWRSRFEWAGNSILVLVCVWLLAFAGSVSISMASISGILCTVFALIMPVVLFIMCRKKSNHLNRIPWPEWALMGMILFAFASVIMIYFFKLGWRIKNNDMGHKIANTTRANFNEYTTCSQL